ncbi:hypothetical protein NXW84_11680 [Bacteroides fragilis]|nr:hypothetical protein NXW84_11680 [Bacteroides fragilis]
MDEQELFDLRRSLETIRDIIRFLQRNDEEESDCPYPSLKKLAGDITVFPQLITKIDGILNKYGKIKDNASTELSRIRRELANTMGSISRSLNSILRNAQSGRLCGQRRGTNHARRSIGYSGGSGIKT